MYSVVQKVSKSLLRRYTLPKFLACTARTFGKVFHFTSKATTPPITPTAPTIPITPTAPTNRLSGLSPFGVVGNCQVSELGALVPRLSEIFRVPLKTPLITQYSITFSSLSPFGGSGALVIRPSSFVPRHSYFVIYKAHLNPIFSIV